MAGIRIHDVTFTRLANMTNANSTLERIVRANPTSVEFGKAQLLHKDFLSLVSGLATSRPEVMFIAGTQSLSELDTWKSIKDINSAQKMAAVEVSCSAPDSSAYPDIETTLSIIKHAHEAGIQVKTRLLGAFKDADGNEADKQLIQDAVLCLADGGADVIVVADTTSLADEDEVIETMEALLWFDVSGESMMERLGFRGSQVGLRGPIQSYPLIVDTVHEIQAACLAAAKLGITHFETVARDADTKTASSADASTLAQALRDMGKVVQYKE